MYRPQQESDRSAQSAQREWSSAGSAAAPRQTPGGRQTDWTPAIAQRSPSSFRASSRNRPARLEDPPLKSHASASGRTRCQDQGNRAAARALGWASIGIGLTELCCPRHVQKLMGVEDQQTTGMLRVCGVREIAQGVDILTHKNPAPGMWARVTGDVIDGVLLGLAAMKTRKLAGLLTICAAVLPIVVADAVVAPRVTGNGPGSNR